ncbi:MAG: hypothetical protein K5666_03825 [Bacilli bacterium]|nr:hypothetical protein [Bacilli bacterium]
MLSIGASVGSFIMDAFCAIFIGLLDGVVYLLLSLIYAVWEVLAKVDIFGGGTAGEKIYEQFTARIFTVISIVMVFMVAYNIIKYIMDPDGDSVKKTSGLVKQIIISVLMCIFAPLIFKYMAVFQYHVVANNTIPNIVLGTNGGNRKISSGKQLSMVVLMSFYHPYNTSYNDFVVNPNGDNCQDIITMNQGGDEVREEWANQMLKWCEDDGSAPQEITGHENFWSQIGEEEGCEYMWIICTGVGVLVCYMLVQYCIAIGTRAVRLGFLEIIAPFPILIKPFDKTTYDNWFKEMKTTYLELFIRIAVISFVVFVCSLIPGLISAIWNSF